MRAGVEQTFFSRATGAHLCASVAENIRSTDLAHPPGIAARTHHRSCFIFVYSFADGVLVLYAFLIKWTSHVS